MRAVQNRLWIQLCMSHRDFPRSSPCRRIGEMIVKSSSISCDAWRPFGRLQTHYGQLQRIVGHAAVMYTMIGNHARAVFA